MVALLMVDCCELFSFIIILRSKLVLLDLDMAAPVVVDCCIIFCVVIILRFDHGRPADGLFPHGWLIVVYILCYLHH